MANIELLKDAYAILAGIPDQQINLDLFYSSYDPKDHKHCGTIACGAGWLALHQQFRDRLLKQPPPRISPNSPDLWHTLLVWNTGMEGSTTAIVVDAHNAWAALAHCFDIEYDEARDLFMNRDSTTYHKYFSHGTLLSMSDKQLLLARIKIFIEQKQAAIEIPA